MPYQPSCVSSELKLRVWELLASPDLGSSFEGEEKADLVDLEVDDSQPPVTGRNLKKGIAVDSLIGVNELESSVVMEMIMSIGVWLWW